MYENQKEWIIFLVDMCFTLSFFLSLMTEIVLKIVAIVRTHFVLCRCLDTQCTCLGSSLFPSCSLHSLFNYLLSQPPYKFCGLIPPPFPMKVCYTGQQAQQLLLLHKHNHKQSGETGLLGTQTITDQRNLPLLLLRLFFRSLYIFTTGKSTTLGTCDLFISLSMSKTFIW